MASAKSLLLSSAVLFVSAAIQPPYAEPNGVELAQAQPGGEKDQKPQPRQAPPTKRAAPPQQAQPPSSKPAAPPPAAPHPAPPPIAQPPRTAAPPPVEHHPAPPVHQPALPPQAQPPHAAPQPPSQRPAAPPPAAPHPAPPPIAQPPRPAPPPIERHPAPLPEQHQPAPPSVEQHPPPSAAEQHTPPAAAPAPHEQRPQRPVQAPLQAAPQQTQPAQVPPPRSQTPPAATSTPQQTPPRPAGPPTQQPPSQATPLAAPVAPPPPQQPRDTRQFIRQPGQQAPAPTIQDLRRERQETREGNATIIREGDRTIVREGQRTIIWHSESDRFAVGARDVRVEQRGNQTYSTIERPNGDRIITITDERGHLLRRVRREPNGREIVIIDESGIPHRDNYLVAVPPPRYPLPPDRYYVDIDRVPPERIYDTLIAPPFEPIEEVYTVDEVRYSPGLRMMMQRVDLDINFETGSWQITPEQMGNLEVIARALNRAIERNPREVFLIEGHTDAVGTEEDNLSLSDRRAESVAVALTQEFRVPPENLITQGYGEQELKVPTMGPSRENRRVAIRRITPLIDRTAAR